MFLFETNVSSNTSDGWVLASSIFTSVLTLGTLIVTAYYYNKSTKAAERAAKSSEDALKFAAESARSATESVKISEKVAQTAADTLGIQRQHNIKSVTPILFIDSYNHDEEVSVKLTNNGIGPVIVNNLRTTNGQESHYNLINWMPWHPRGVTYWKTFQNGFDGGSIYPGNSVNFLFLENDNENFPDYVLFRAFVRRNLSKLSMSVQYSDIYGNLVGTENLDFSGFGKTNSKWFKENFPKDFADNFRLELKSSKLICSVEEWKEKVDFVTKNYKPNQLSEKDIVDNSTFLRVD